MDPLKEYIRIRLCFPRSPPLSSETLHALIVVPISSGYVNPSPPRIQILPQRAPLESFQLITIIAELSRSMLGVMQKFLFASMAMWMVPVAILYWFNYHVFPGSTQFSPSSQTLISGFLAVISVNVVIVFYIYFAMKEPANHEPQPDPAFLAEAKSSISQPTAPPADAGDAQAREKME